MSFAPAALTVRILSVNTGTVRPLRVGERTLMSGIGKSGTAARIAVGPLGLAGDEQADPSVHGGLAKAVYAYPQQHYAFWEQERRTRGVSLFDEPLPPGFVGENLTVDGPLEHEVYVGDLLEFPDCVLRITAPREPCSKFNAVMGFAQAGRAMALAGCCGYYLAVDRAGTVAAGDQGRLVPGQRGLSIREAFAAKLAKHLR